MLLYFVWRRMIPVFPRTKNAFQIISTLPWPIYAADMLICQYVLICWYGAIMLIYFSQDRECRLLSRLLSALSWLRWLSVSEHQCNCDLDDCCDYYYYHTPLLFAFLDALASLESVMTVSQSVRGYRIFREISDQWFTNIKP